MRTLALAIVVALLSAALTCAGERSPRVEDFVGDGSREDEPAIDCDGPRVRHDKLYGTLTYGNCRKAPERYDGPMPTPGPFHRGRLPRKGSALDPHLGIPFKNPPNR